MYPELQQIYWYSGVYLQPQHLQSVDLHHHYMLSRQRQLAQPWNVGLIESVFNPETLVDFSLKIERLKALLPSGDYLEFPGNCSLPPRQFRQVWKQLEKPLTLWLALRRFDPGHVNVGESPNSRWLKAPEEGVMKDVYFDGPECSVSRILYNVQILTDSEKDAVVDCEFIPLLRLRYDTDRVIVDPRFCPPLVSLGSTSVLKDLLDGLYAELANRAYKFEEYKRPEQANTAQRGDMTQLLVMRSLNRVLPLLQHYCRTPGMHPWPIYGLLAQLIGELSSFSDRCSFTGEWVDESQRLLPYDHDDLYACFASAKNILLSLLNNLALEDNVWVMLVPTSQRIFIGDLSPLAGQQSAKVLLRLRSESLVTHPVDSAGFKVAPASAVNKLIQHALPGIAASVLDPAPRGVPQSKGAVYYLLDQHDDHWKKIGQEQSLAFYWDDAPDDLQVQAVFMGVS